MNEVFAMPYHYLREVGVNECFLLSYLTSRITVDNDNISSFMIKKSEIQEKSEINFLKAPEIDAALDKLFNMGFVFFVLRNGSKTKTISVSLVNLVLFELYGKDRYMSLLSDYVDKKFCGKMIPRDSLIKEEMSFPKYPSITGKGFYLDYTEGIDNVYNEICSVYDFNIDKIDKYIENNKFIPKKEDKFNVKSLFLFSRSAMGICCDLPFYRIVCFGGDVSINKTLKKEEPDNTVKEEEETPLKVLARNDYKKYCEYMRMGVVMKKPISSWTALDFVSYFYCGLAKLKESEGDFVFPDFSKDTKRMKNIMERYGFRRLYKVIYNMIKNRDEIREQRGMNDFVPSVSSLCTDWIFEKILSFSEEREEKEMRESISNAVVIKNDIDLKKTEDCSKLNEYRDKFNKNKETK